jgi:hypothetical protein
MTSQAVGLVLKETAELPKLSKPAAEREAGKFAYFRRGYLRDCTRLQIGELLSSSKFIDDRCEHFRGDPLGQVERNS